MKVKKIFKVISTGEFTLNIGADDDIWSTYPAYPASAGMCRVTVWVDPELPKVKRTFLWIPVDHDYDKDRFAYCRNAYLSGAFNTLLEKL